MDEVSPKNSEDITTKFSSSIPKKESKRLHGPSLGIGAGIATVSIIAAFLVINMADTDTELQFEENLPEPKVSAEAMEVFTGNGSPYLGDSNAPITLVEFGDYQCFYCNKFFHETEPNIVADYVNTGKIKIIFKDFTIIGPNSISAAHAAHCADDQGKFWEYHDELYNNWAGENNGWAAPENLIKFAQNVDLNEEEFNQCMNSGKYQQMVSASSTDARNLGITGTPAFFVIGPDNQITRIPGAQPYEVFSGLFEEELKK